MSVLVRDSLPPFLPRFLTPLHRYRNDIHKPDSRLMEPSGSPSSTPITTPSRPPRPSSPRHSRGRLTSLRCSSVRTARLRQSRPYTKCSTTSRDICARVHGSSGRYPMQISWCTSVTPVESPSPLSSVPPLVWCANEYRDRQSRAEEDTRTRATRIWEVRHRPGVDYYGHLHHFYLDDAVEDMPEFVVHWRNFETCVSLPSLPVALTQSSSYIVLPTVDTQHCKIAQLPSLVQTRVPPYLP